MVLEQLINGYLDADLTKEQDSELRTILRSDPNAKNDFDAAVLVHIGISCQDERPVPDSLRTSVFDGIEMRCGSHLPQNRVGKESVPDTRGIVLSGQLYRTAIVTAVLLLILCAPVADTMFDDSLFGFTANTDTTVRMDERLLSAAGGWAQTTTHNAHNRNANSFGVPSPVANREVPDATDLFSSTTEMNIPADLFASNDYSESKSDVQAVADRYANVIQEESKALATASTPAIALMALQNITSQPPQMQNQTGMPEPPSTTMIFATAYSSGVGSTIKGASNIHQIATSIGYEIGQNSVMGLEIGSTSYTLERTFTGAQPMEGSRSAMVVTPLGSNTGNGKLSSPSSAALRYQTDSIAVARTQSVVWGSAFVERQFITTSIFGFRARVGAGVSEEGLLGYGRLVGVVKAGQILSFTVGAEVRGMNFQTGSVGGRATATSFGTFVTALTGVSVSF